MAIIRCKLCNWKTLRWSKKKGRKLATDGFNRLREHYFSNHAEYLEKIEEYIGVEDENDGKEA